MKTNLKADWFLLMLESGAVVDDLHDGTDFKPIQDSVLNAKC